MNRPPPPEDACPRCGGGVLPAARYCPACGQDMRWTAREHRPFRRVPRALDVRKFQLAADLAASRALAAAAPVQAAVRYYLRRIAEPEYRNQLLANAIRVSPTQQPRVHRLARHCERILHTSPVEVYVSTSTEAAAFSFGSGDTDAIVITSTLIDFIPDDDQLLFVLGQQLGHVKADHVVYQTVAKAMSTALKGIPALGGALSGAVNFLLVPWQRTATLTADRAGLLCCQDLRKAAIQIARMTLGYGTSISTINIEEFLAQSAPLRASGEWGDTWKPVPALARRLFNLVEFRDSKSWAEIFEGAWDPLSPRFPCYYCPGGAAPARIDSPLDRLRCGDCGRDLMIDQVGCPHCCAPIPVAVDLSLDDLQCPACDELYLDDDRVGLYQDAAVAAPAGLDSYATLGVHPTASPARLRRAFRDRMDPLEARVAGVGGPDPVPEKIRVYAAFKTLIDPARRAAHDARLGHARQVLARDPDAPGARCPACGALRPGEYCGLCGHRPGREAGEPAGVIGALAAELARLAAADVGELHREAEAPFELAFHLRRRALFFRRGGDLDRPGAIRALLRAAADATRALRPATASEVYAVLDGVTDHELIASIVGERRGPASRGRFRLRFLEEDGAGRVRERAPSGGGASGEFVAVADWVAATVGT